jgi:chromosome segregation ATPase
MNTEERLESDLWDAEQKIAEQSRAIEELREELEVEKGVHELRDGAAVELMNRITARERTIAELRDSLTISRTTEANLHERCRTLVAELEQMRIDRNAQRRGWEHAHEHLQSAQADLEALRARRCETCKHREPPTGAKNPTCALGYACTNNGYEDAVRDDWGCIDWEAK